MKKVNFVVLVIVLSFVFWSCNGVYGSLKTLSTCESLPVALFVAIVAGIVVNVLGWLFICVWNEFKYRHLNKFWRPLREKYISIVLSEYEMVGSIENFELAKNAIDNSLFSEEVSNLIGCLLKSVQTNKIAEKVANGVLVSKGNAKALSHLMTYLPKHVTKPEKIIADGDKSGRTHYEDLVLVGSPMTNNYSQQIFSFLEERYNIPFEIDYNETTGEIRFIYKKDNTFFEPEINTNNGCGRDYAIIINADYKITPDNKNRHVIILAGTYMYGTEAASKVITNKKVFKTITRNVKEINNCIFLIEVNIIDGVLQEPQLKINNRYYIFPLEEKR